MSRVYRATVHAEFNDGTLIEPSLHYQTDVPTGGDEPAPADVADGIWGVWGTQFLACCPPTVSVHDLVVTEQVLPPDTAVQGSKHVGLNGSIIGSGTGLPRGLVPIINLHTDTVSRNARGHICMPSPLDNSFLVGNNWSSGMIAALDALAAKLDDSFDLGTIIITHVNPVIYSRTRRVRGQSPWTFRVTSASTNHVPHWLRSRMTSP